MRKFAKAFEKELLLYLNKVVRQEIENRKENEKILEEADNMIAKDPVTPASLPKKESEEE